MSRRRRQDAFGKQARREGFPARSVYKLEEIDRRVGLLRRGQRVLDLGAFPGSWTLYAAEKVGAEGRVVGIDLQPFEGALPPQAQMLQGDLRDPDVLTRVGLEEVDVVLSDMAPATTGQRQLDMYRSFELAMRALDVATERLAPGGAFVAKIFQGGEFPEAKKAVQQRFSRFRTVKPKATRSESYEVFLVGQGFRGRAEAPAP